MIKSSFREMDLGAIRTTIAPFALGSEVEQQLKKMLDIKIVTLGQGGGRKGAELARFGWDIWMVNSATVDMREHEWIERKIVLVDPDRGKIEGTAKNAAVGHAIAQKNVKTFKEIAIDTQDADLVIIPVALGGGQGNGSIPTAAEWIVKVREMAGKPRSAVFIVSIPSRDESNPDVWKNALSGLKYLQELIIKKQIGAVMLVDNELIRNYYEREDEFQYHNRSFSALDYSNITVARTFFEIMTLPLLSGQVSLDSAELMEILSTPGWITVNKREFNFGDKINLEHEIESLFSKNEVFASLDVGNSIAGGIALITSKGKNVQPAIIDQVKPVANKFLGKPSILHSAIIQTTSITTNSYLIGLSVSPKLPETIIDSLVQKYEEEKKRKQERESQALEAPVALGEFDSVFDQSATASERKKVSLDDLDSAEEVGKRRVTIDEI